jgi:hypothetical protein
MPGVVDRWECNEPVLNIRFLDFATHYSFAALVAPRRCPTWKAVAENLFGYHEKNLLNGRDIRRIEDYREALAWWRREKAHGIDHPEEKGTTVGEMLERERPHLLPLPAKPYDTRDVCVRYVDDYGRVQLDTNHYPVPAPVGARVYVCAGPDGVEICDPHARRLVDHERLPAGAGIKLDPPQVRRARYDIDELVTRVSDWGEAAAAFARGVRSVRRTPGPELVRLLQLQVKWSVDDIVAAMAHAEKYRCFEVTKLERILALKYTPRQFEELIAETTRQRVREVMKNHPVGHRPLSDYPSLRHGDSAPEADAHVNEEPDETESA